MHVMAIAGDWPVGVCVFDEPAPNQPRTISYPNYIDEILTHAGVCYGRVKAGELADALRHVRLLVTIGEHALDDRTRAPLRKWIESGGGWLSVGGVCGMDDVIGATLARGYEGWGAGAAMLGEGYLTIERAGHRALAHVEKPLHFFNGAAVEARGATVLARALDAHGRETDRPVILEHTFGRGRTLFIAVDVTGTIVRVQQGVAVTRDGVPAPDGSAALTDGVLKTGDGGVLDWMFDRDPVEGVPGLHAFLRPVADLWRETLLRAIFHLAGELRIPLPLLWLYPRNLGALAHLSHDSDLNEPDRSRRLLDLLAAARIKSTWCIILPGYDRPLTNAIREAGHELAMHFDAMSERTRFTEDEFDRQWHELRELFGGAAPITNKNHYLRWEGDCEFFRWCAARGIQFDQSKGASKPGEAGFNFGTCHPYFAVEFDGSSIDVLELPTPTQDLNVFAPESLLQPLLESVRRRHGILHLLFHPTHVIRDEVAGAVGRSVKLARDRGMEWWTAAAINNWERARRKVRWSDYHGSDSGASVKLSVADELTDATILWLATESAAAPATERWGFRFQPTVMSLSKNSTSRFSCPD
jgi:peptidoglycan/xylan/chitin deacetylase (PgdA/CDA1 family)